jgi:hypothetical protein
MRGHHLGRESTMRHAQRARGLGLVLVGVLVGMLLLTPAGAHFTRDPQHLGEHAWHGVIKHRVWTRAQADRRFIRDASGAVGTDTLANRAVTTLKIALGAVGTERLANGAVTTLKIARGAVGTERLANGAVTNAKIAPRAVGNTKIANRAVSSGKLATGAVTGPKLAAITQVTAETALLATGSSGTVTATCASGTVVIGGGFDNLTDAGASTTGVRIGRSLRVGNGWRVAGVNQGASSVRIRAIAYCLIA